MFLRTDKRQFEKGTSPQKLVYPAPFFCLLSDRIQAGNGGFSSCYEGRTLFPWKLSLPMIQFHFFWKKRLSCNLFHTWGGLQSTYFEKPKSMGLQQHLCNVYQLLGTVVLLSVSLSISTFVEEDFRHHELTCSDSTAKGPGLGQRREEGKNRASVVWSVWVLILALPFTSQDRLPNLSKSWFLHVRKLLQNCFFISSCTKRG